MNSCFKTAQEFDLVIELKPTCLFSGHHKMAAYSRKFKGSVLSLRAPNF